MTLTRRIGWMVWALVPVVVLAYHFGPGQVLMARDVALTRYQEAIQLEQAALELQRQAYARHLDTIEVRRTTFLSEDEEQRERKLAEATEQEREAYEAAADQWQIVAETYEHVMERLPDEDPETMARMQWAKGRAMVRSGAVWDGAAELDDLLFDLSESASSPESDSLMRATREELAAAYYFGARLLRLQGKPADQWRPEARRARQHFRYLAEAASREGADPEVVRGLEDNVERTINLEQMDHSELEGQPLPRQSPRTARGGGPRPGRRAGITQRPPGEGDARGANGAGPIGPGW
ncbi:MAG: hypothetical protein CMJ39_10045 [Phycisphaerae bacterium]|nr:hypothetical protein [Phycisphaerae bacterium]